MRNNLAFLAIWQSSSSSFNWNLYSEREGRSLLGAHVPTASGRGQGEAAESRTHRSMIQRSPITLQRQLSVAIFNRLKIYLTIIKSQNSRRINDEPVKKRRYKSKLDLEYSYLKVMDAITRVTRGEYFKEPSGTRWSSHPTRVKWSGRRYSSELFGWLPPLIPSGR